MRRPKWATNPLWPRRDDVTDWSMRRVHDDGTEEKLVWWWYKPDGTQDFGVYDGLEMRHLTPKAVLRQWGPGWYRVYYAGTDATGRRRPRGRSELVRIEDPDLPDLDPGPMPPRSPPNRAPPRRRASKAPAPTSAKKPEAPSPSKATPALGSPAHIAQLVAFVDAWLVAHPDRVLPFQVSGSIYEAFGHASPEGQRTLMALLDRSRPKP